MKLADRAVLVYAPCRKRRQRKKRRPAPETVKGRLAGRKRETNPFGRVEGERNTTSPGYTRPPIYVVSSAGLALSIVGRADIGSGAIVPELERREGEQ